MKEKKKALREVVRATARAVIPTEPDRATRDLPYNNVIDKVESLPEWAAARTVALYHALPDEVPTAGMLHRWRERKRLVLPVISGDGGMVFREYGGEESLGIGAFGIREPECGAVVPPQEIDLMVVPGMAFDNAGRRLGRGGGFYDRYLSQPAAAHIHKVGLCRSGALVAEVPAEAHDVVMDVVITN